MDDRTTSSSSSSSSSSSPSQLNKPFQVKMNKIPVTILTGFLGSGKTTLLNYILNDKSHGLRIAVIENEFGEDVIEQLVAKDGLSKEVLPDFYTMSNGCICCTVRDELVETLERLMDLPSDSKSFDYIIVETTGMANAGSVASSFWVDDELEGKLFLDGIVTLVDAYRITSLLSTATRAHETMSICTNQIAFADRLLLNKSDLVQNICERTRVEALVRQFNPLAPLVWTQKAKCMLHEILNIGAFSKSSALQMEAKLAATSAISVNENQPLCLSITNTCVETDNPLNIELLTRWIGGLVWEQEEGKKNGMHIFRIKGILSISFKESKYILQGVYDLFEISETGDCWENEIIAVEHRHSKIVFIGTGLSYEKLHEGLETCAVV